MREKKKLPIGKSDFKDLIDNNCYYVDKTLFIKEIIDSSADILLIPRPRRFGKTLNLSMLRYFFEQTDDDRAIYSKILKSGRKMNIIKINRANFQSFL